jgi:hypothetical protein
MRSPLSATAAGTVAGVLVASTVSLFFQASLLQASERFLGSAMILLLVAIPGFVFLGLPLAILVHDQVDNGISLGPALGLGVLGGALMGLLYLGGLGLISAGADGFLFVFSPRNRWPQAAALGGGAAFGLVAAWTVTLPSKPS